MSDVFQWPFSVMVCIRWIEHLRIVSVKNVDLQMQRGKRINLALFARKLIKIAFQSDSVDWFDTT